MNRDTPRLVPSSPVISSSLDDLLTPGVMVEVAANVAAASGAFEETALTEQEAWESRDDLIGDHDDE
jgi:type IV secretion system protein VirB1